MNAEIELRHLRYFVAVAKELRFIDTDIILMELL
jgi:hypothetical protein